MEETTRRIQRDKKTREEKKETEREKGERKRAVSPVKGTGGVSSPSRYKEVVWEGGYDR